MIVLKRSSEICKELGFKTVAAMHKYLQSQGMVERVQNRWQLTRQYVGCDLARLKYNRRVGWKLYWTAEGIAFLKDMNCGQGRLVAKRISA